MPPINHKWGCLLVMAVCGGYLDAQSAKSLLRASDNEKARVWADLKAKGLVICQKQQLQRQCSIRRGGGAVKSAAT